MSVLRSATVSIAHEIDLPKSPPMVIVGRGKDGKVVCQLNVNATGIEICGPKGGVIKELYWEGLVDLAKSE